LLIFLLVSRPVIERPADVPDAPMATVVSADAQGASRSAAAAGRPTGSGGSVGRCVVCRSGCAGCWQRWLGTGGRVGRPGVDSFRGVPVGRRVGLGSRAVRGNCRGQPRGADGRGLASPAASGVSRRGGCPRPARAAPAPQRPTPAGL
jgi:hypothetical protein